MNKKPLIVTIQRIYTLGFEFALMYDLKIMEKTTLLDFVNRFRIFILYSDGWYSDKYIILV